MNLVVLRGNLSSSPRVQPLPSGDELARLEVTTPGPDGARSVPVVVVNPGSVVVRLAPGDAVMVTGVVRRRFWRQGGTTRSSTEVVAERVVPGGHRRRIDRALARVRDELARPPSG